MDKNPITEKPPIDETPRAKSGKHKKHITACVDKRRDSHHCGICGSEDIAYEQLIFCEVCEKEVFNIGVKLHWRMDKLYPCTCKGELVREYKGNKFYKTVHWDITNRVCLACGSMAAKTCPVCKNMIRISYHSGKDCWTSPIGEKYCQYCGYRSPGYKKEK